MQLLSLSFKIGSCFLSTCFKLNKKKKGTRSKKCIWGQERCVKYDTRKAATRIIDPLSFLGEVAKNFRISRTHCWKKNEKPTILQLTVLVLKLITFNANHPKTPFTVSKSTFSNLKKTPVSELQAIEKCISKKFLNDFSEGKGIKCWYTGKELVLQSCSGFNKLSIDQGETRL